MICLVKRICRGADRILQSHRLERLPIHNTRCGTRSVLFRIPADVRDLIAGLVPDRRPDLVQDLGQDLSDRSGTRFGIRDLVRLESDLASDQVPDLAPDQLPDLVQDVAPDFGPVGANSVRDVVLLDARLGSKSHI